MSAKAAKIKHQPYSEYHDSGVSWLGQIPKGWRVEKLKYIGEISLGKMLQPERAEKSDSLKPYLRAQNVGWFKVDHEDVKEMWFSSSELTKHRIKSGDLLVSEGGEVGRTAIWNDELPECYVQNSINRVTIRNTHIPRFYLYALASLGSDGIFDAIVNRISIAHLTREKLKEVPLVVPPKHEQLKIAKYLDEKVGVIDAAVAAKRRQVELLREHRSALIHHAVTKGLDPAAPLIDSGIPWLGKIPKGWRVEKLKYLAPLRGAKVESVPIESPYLGLENIQSGLGRLVSENIVSDGEGMSNIFEPGDVLFGKLRPYLAKVLWVDFSGFCTGELLVLSASKKLSPRYLKYRLLSNDFISIVDNSTFGAKMPRADWAFIGNLPTAFPEIDNQQKIAEYLDKKTGQIDLTIGCVERSIELLMEYRTSLIHSAVTGKILIS